MLSSSSPLLLKVVVRGPVPVRGPSAAGPQKLSKKGQKKIVSAGKIVYRSLVQWKKFLPVRHTKKFEKHWSKQLVLPNHKTVALVKTHLEQELKN